MLRYQYRGEVRVGILDGEHVVDLSDALVSEGTLTEGDQRIITDTTALIAAGEYGRELSERALELSRSKGIGRKPLAGLPLRAPLRPKIILCSGKNYWDHREEKPPVEGKEPEFFIKVPHGVIGPDEDIVLDPPSNEKTRLRNKTRCGHRQAWAPYFCRKGPPARLWLYGYE